MPSKQNGKKPAASSFTLKIEAVRSCEASFDFNRSTQRHNPKYDTLHDDRSESLKSNFYQTKLHQSQSTLFMNWLIFVRI
jgi:hypothetical protein